MADIDPSADDEQGLADIVHPEGVLYGDPRIEGRRIGGRHASRSRGPARASPVEIEER